MRKGTRILAYIVRDENGWIEIVKRLESPGSIVSQCR